MKTVIYATDCSRHSTPAMRYAYSLCKVLEATLVILNVFDLPPVRVSTIRTSQQLKNLASKEQMIVLRNYCSRYLKDKMDSDIVLDVMESNSISSGILKRAHDLSADLIIVGMKDEHTLRGYFSGNIASTLLAQAPCPIFIVPNRLRYKKLRTLVYATDFEEKDIDAILKLTAIAKPYDAEIKIVHIPTPDEYAGMEQMEWFKEILQQRVTYPKLRFHMIFADNIQEGLSAFVKDVNADLLAMLERKSSRGFFARLFHKDKVAGMESHVDIPLLSFNGKTQ